MKKINNTLSIIFFNIVILSAKNVYAYIDPGTGSMMIQVIIAVVAAVGVSVGVAWGRIKNIINRVLGKK